MRAKPRRVAGRPAPKKRRRRLGTLLVLVGVMTLLGGTFVAGALAGRLSLRPSAATNPQPPERAERATKTAPGSKAAGKAAAPAAPPPELTFYRELTAPLTPPPMPAKPVAKPARAAPSLLDAPRADAAVPAAPTAPAPAKAPEPPRADGARYTVQVGSYNVRAQADALRARLAAAGHDAYVAEGEAGGVTRYRVRIGAFVAADDARQAAAQLASEAHVATYVTTR